MQEVLWRNRTLIDYVQWIIDRPMLMEDGAPFLWDGPGVYWSIVDDPEIELLKALWEGEAYLKIPLPRRVQGKPEWLSRSEYLEEAKKLVQWVGSLPRLCPQGVLRVAHPKRGVRVLAAYVAYPDAWNRIEVTDYFTKAMVELCLFAQQRQMHRLKEVLVLVGPPNPLEEAAYAARA